MLSVFASGIALGFAAAVPIGPINLLILQKHLREGQASGIALGLGACFADLCYLLLLYFGYSALLASFAEQPILHVISSVVLLYFAWQAWHMSPDFDLSDDKSQTSFNKRHYLQHGIQGFLLTAVNPYTILFWSSIVIGSQQIVMAHSDQLVVLGSGLMIATVSWVIIWNGLIACLKKRTGQVIRKYFHWLNRAASIVLVCFAIHIFVS